MIFSDGTGQAGGLQLDEYRTNVYKLLRATRCGPDSSIDPDKQLAFYDPGLGSSLENLNIKVGAFRRIYNRLSSATGLGITNNIVDCYAALIDLWRPGDRIFLFGFSRGAYTVRCLGGVLALCGIPVAEGDKPISRDANTLRRIAREAVNRVYRHGSGSDDSTPAGRERKAKLAAQRQALGEQFRGKFGSNGPLGPNVVPHFIGVWDTVAAVGVTEPVSRILKASGLLAALGLAALMGWWGSDRFGVSYYPAWAASALGLLVAGVGFYYLKRFKYVIGLPGYSWYQTAHLTSFKMAFFDRNLNPNVRYARHAISIDESRADFDRVPWKNDDTPPNREMDEGPWFTQLWFAGNHSDVGGSYPENESRLSDISLDWMVRQAVRAGLIVDRRYLSLFGRANGRQHDEAKRGISWLCFRFNWRQIERKLAAAATVHPSVVERLRLDKVLIDDREGPYRPAALAEHQSFRWFYASPAEKAIMPTLSKDEIAASLTEYFANRFHADPPGYRPTTNIKKRHRFPDSAWEDLANTLSQLPWCIAIGGHIGREQMGTRTRIGQLAKCIFDSTKAVATKAAKKSPVRPRLSMASKRQLELEN